jgi:hypothetical protein
MERGHDPILESTDSVMMHLPYLKDFNLSMRTYCRATFYCLPRPCQLLWVFLYWRIVDIITRVLKPIFKGMQQAHSVPNLMYSSETFVIILYQTPWGTAWIDNDAIYDEAAMTVYFENLWQVPELFC